MSQDDASAREVLGQVTRALRHYVKAHAAEGALGSTKAPEAQREAWAQTTKRARRVRMDRIQASLRGGGDQVAPQAAVAAPHGVPVSQPVAQAVEAASTLAQGAGHSSPNVPFGRVKEAPAKVPESIQSIGPSPWKTLGSRPKRSRNSSSETGRAQAAVPPKGRPVNASSPSPPRKQASAGPPDMDIPPPFDMGEPMGEPAWDDAPPMGEAPGPPPRRAKPPEPTPAPQPTPAPAVPARPPKAGGAATPNASMTQRTPQPELGGPDWTRRAVALKGYDDTPELGKRLDQLSQSEKMEFLRECMGDCTRCQLSQSRTNIVFGDGNPEADIVFVGEGPGYHEDKEGTPFVGDSGQLLNKMIRAMGLSREEIYIANVVKCRPPKNRDPQPAEIGQCAPFLYKQLETVNPRVIVTLGKFAAQTLLNNKGPMKSMRGRWHDWRCIPVMPTYHPAYLLRSPEQKRMAWEDLQKVMRVLGLGS